MSISRSSFAVHFPLEGKPHPSERYPLKGEKDTRSRIHQKASDLSNCWFYAHKILGRSVGKHPKSQHLQERAFEILSSKRRKAIAEHDTSLPYITYYLDNPEIQRRLQAITPRSLYREVEALIQDIGLQNGPNLASIVYQFTQQSEHRDLHSFLEWVKYRKRMEINSQFLQDLGVNLEDCYSEMCALYPTLPKNFNQTHWKSKGWFLDNLVMRLSAERKELYVTRWSPQSSIEDLIDIIDKCGPLYIGGRFGRSFYYESPYEMQFKLEGRKVLAWKPTSSKIKLGMSIHSVVIIGAKKVDERKQYVFFIDPDDESSPSHPRPVYAISYANLVTNAADLSCQFRHPNEPTIGYTYASSFFSTEPSVENSLLYSLLGKIGRIMHYFTPSTN